MPSDETDRFADELGDGQAAEGDSAALARGRRALERLANLLPPAEEAPRPLSATRPPGAGEAVGGVVLEAVIGRGGMGVVWRAHDARLGRAVAVKLLGRASDQDGLERFRLEVEATARLRHPNVVGVHAAGELRGWPFLVMDLVEGESLTRRLDREPGRRLSPRAAVELARPLADALAHAHAQGVVHRDVKPGNVLLDASTAGSPRPRLVDFGLALDLRRDARLTPSGITVGTPAYMAPEQLTGGAVDGRADVWGLGATLHELLTGQPPFPAHTGAALLGALRRRATPPSDHAPLVDAGLDRLVRACLEHDPADRYPSATALRDDLDRWLAGERVRPPGVRRRARRPVLAAAVLATSFVAGAALLPALRPRAGTGPDSVPPPPRPSVAALASRAATELERFVLQAPRGDPGALLALRSPAGGDPEPVRLLASLLLGGTAPRSRVEATLGEEVTAAGRDLATLEERCGYLESFVMRGLDADAEVRGWARLVRRLEALPASEPVALLVRRRAQRLLGRALPALYLQLGRSPLTEPLPPLCGAIEALGPDRAYLLPMRAWLLFMDMETRDAPVELSALLAQELHPPDLPGWQRTLVEAMRIVVRCSHLSAAAAGRVHDDFIDMTWRDASLVVVWLQREVGRLHREEALAGVLHGGAVGPGADDVLRYRRSLEQAVTWGSRAAAHDYTGLEAAELAITLTASTDWSGARDLVSALQIDPALRATLQAEVDLASISAEEALAWVETNLDSGRTPAATATLRLARAHVRARLGQDFEEDLTVAAALLGDRPAALDVPWLHDVKRTRELCLGHAWWPGGR